METDKRHLRDFNSISRRHFIFLLKSMNGISIIDPLQGSLRPSWDGPRFEIL